MGRRLGLVAVLVVTGLAPACAPDPEGPGDSSSLALPAPRSTFAEGGDESEVLRVVDGDTLEVRVDGQREDLRLVGINTPERGECLYAAAARRLGDLVAGGAVGLVRDVSDRDQYGRLLRHVLVDGMSVGEALVAEGLALSQAYPPDITFQVRLDRAQAEAEVAGVGLWAPDACGPASGAQIVVGGTRTDPPGDDSLVPLEEWVEIRNDGPGPVDLTGWGVKDESASHRYMFPDGFRLNAGRGVRLHTGCGSDTATDLHWCVDGSAVWNNDGDTVFVTDPSGNVVDQRAV